MTNEIVMANGITIANAVIECTKMTLRPEIPDVRTQPVADLGMHRLK